MLVLSWSESCYTKKCLPKLVSIGDTAPGTVRRELKGNLVAHQDANVSESHLPGQVSQDHGPIVQLDAERGVRQGLNDRAYSFLFLLLVQGVGKPIYTSKTLALCQIPAPCLTGWEWV